MDAISYGSHITLWREKHGRAAGHDDDARQIIGRLHVPYRAAVAHVETRLRTEFPDLRASHLIVFALIEHPPAGSRLTDLAGAAQLTKASMLELIDALEQRGYVERIPDPVDRRAKRIRLTDHGWAVHERGGEIVADLQAAWAARLGPEKMAHLLDLLCELDVTLNLTGDHPTA